VPIRQFHELAELRLRSDAAGSILIKPSRSGGRMLRPSVVRSVTRSCARPAIVSGLIRFSCTRMENWGVCNPTGAKNWS
jgi:hypothetical protein